MPSLNGLLLPVSGFPVEVRVKVPKSNPTDVIKTIIGTKSDPVTTTCKIGLMFSSGGSDMNALASSIYSEFSGRTSETYGPCFMVGEDEKGGMSDLPKESVEKVALLYQNLTGSKPPGLSLRKPKKEQQGPKKAKKAGEFFKKQFYEARGTELKQQNLKFNVAEESKNASEAWKKLSPEEKAPYLASEAEDKARFDREMAEWVIKNPPKPSRPRTAIYYYNQAHPEKDNRPEFSSLADEEKKVFEAKAEEDKKRYEVQLDKFREHCEETGKDFDEEMKPKKRPPKGGVAAVEKKTKGKTAEPVRKPTKKQKTTEGGAKAVGKKAATTKGKKKGGEDDGGQKKKRKKPAEEEEEEAADEAAVEEAEEAEEAGSDDE